MASAVQIRLIWHSLRGCGASVAFPVCSGHLLMPVWESPPPAVPLDGR